MNFFKVVFLSLCLFVAGVNAFAETEITQKIHQYKSEFARFKARPTFVITEKIDTLEIFFGFDSQKLSEGEKRKLNTFSTIYTGSVDVTGYTDSIGSYAVNKVVSQKRAREVANYLRSLGITVNRVRGKPMCCYRSKNPAENRRVEVAYHPNLIKH